jgi:hypothetical protein
MNSSPEFRRNNVSVHRDRTPLFTTVRRNPMKRFAQLAIISALSIPGATFAQSGDMKGMEMKNGCMDMKDMKGMDMKDMKNMNMQECKNMMKEHTADSKAQGAHKQGFCRIVEREAHFSRPNMAAAYAGRTSPASA